MTCLGYHHCFDPRFRKQASVTGYILRHDDPCAPNFAYTRFDQNEIVHLRGRFVINLHAANDPDHFLAKRALGELDMMNVL